MYKVLNSKSTTYLIYDSGHIWTTRYKRFLLPRLHKGYDHVFLKVDDGQRKQYNVGRLVAQAFLPNPDNLPEINHKNHIRNDNRVDNLEWCTRDYNIKDNIRFGSHAALATRKLTPKIMREFKKLYQESHNLSKIAIQLGVKREVLSDWKNGRSYKEFPWPE